MNAQDLQRFCADSDDIRYYLREPWSDGDYSYATNGHIILRVARLPNVEEQPKAPNAEVLFAKTKPASNWLPIPVATMPPDVDCERCRGTKRDLDDRRFKCDVCGGTGKQRAQIGVRVGGASFDQGYLSMLQGWEIAPNGKAAAWIRNGNAQGLLMPRNE